MLIILPIIPGLHGTALRISVVTGAGLIGDSLLTDDHLGIVKVLNGDLHQLLDMAAGTGSLATPALLGFDEVTTVYYIVMAVGVIAVVADSARLSNELSPS